MRQEKDQLLLDLRSSISLDLAPSPSSSFVDLTKVLADFRLNVERALDDDLIEHHHPQYPVKPVRRSVVLIGNVKEVLSKSFTGAYSFHCDVERCDSIIPSELRIGQHVDHILIWFTNYHHFPTYQEKLQILISQLIEYKRNIVLIPPTRSGPAAMQFLQNLVLEHHQKDPSISFSCLSPTCSRDCGFDWASADNQPTAKAAQEIYSMLGDIIERLKAKIPCTINSESRQVERVVALVEGRGFTLTKPSTGLDSDPLCAAMQTFSLLHQDPHSSAKEEILKIVEELILGQLGKHCTLPYSFKLYPTGSSFSGLALDSSDLDICLWLDDRLSDIRHPKRPEKGTPYQYDSRNLVEQTLKALRTARHKPTSSGRTLTRVFLHIARIPMIELHFDPPAPFVVEIGLHNRLSVLNTILIRSYVQSDSRVPIVVKVVKHFLKSSLWNGRHSFIDAPSGGLNSYAVTLLVIQFLHISHTILTTSTHCPHNSESSSSLHAE